MRKIVFLVFFTVLVLGAGERGLAEDKVPCDANGLKKSCDAGDFES